MRRRINMSNIKVTVAYEKPTTSKFDALMEEYEAAKKYADETVAYYKPLADAAEDAKFDAIMEQLETIKMYARRIAEIRECDKREVCITAGVHGYMRGDSCSSVYFEVEYRPDTCKFVVACDHMPFVKGRFCEGRHNFVGKWEEWKIYEQLEKNACDQLQSAIKAQEHRSQKQIDRLNNIVKM
jgi:hypothetical protein